MKSKNYFSKFAIAILFLVFGLNSNANNVTITGTSVSGSDITFTLSWENSWNANIAPANWDAVWIFIKYQDCNTRLWAHAGLSTVASDHTAGAPLQVDTVIDGKGVFVRRSALGGGNISPTTVTLHMTIPTGTYNYKVFGIEMVNVPQGAFDLGDGTSSNTFNSISINGAAQSGGLTSAAIGGAAVAVPSTFPMGYNSFYCMKYEISQEQYVDFLNSLTYDQQSRRTVNDPIGVTGAYAMNAGYYYRNGIRILTSGNNNAIPAIYSSDSTAGVPNNSDDGQNVACSGLSWGDVSAYLDWAALRPMSEMEFEKVCRGSVPRVSGEYAWGTTELFQVLSNAVTNGLKANEGFATITNGLCAYGLNSGSTGYGPLRCGIFATATSGRASSGASFYGAMEMSGNLSERVVTLANTTGATFTGNNGDGSLTTNGDANQTSWPDPTTAVGSGFRGGNYSYSATYLSTSDRTSAGNTLATRGYTQGGRGVR